MADLSGKIALVTGARRGIGRATALELAKDGADIAALDVENEGDLDRVVADVQALGRRAIAIQADVSRSDQVAAAVDRVVEELGGIDILVNNAGVESIIPFLELSEDEWERITHINLKGEFLMGQAVARKMVEQGRGGAIVNFGSIQAGMVMEGRTHYAPSKRAVEALTANMAVELASHRIRVNCINPGLIDTEMTEWVMKNEEILPGVLEKIAMKRAGDPNEIGRVVSFLVSDDASYVTGQTLYVDGGWRIQ